MGSTCSNFCHNDFKQKKSLVCFLFRLAVATPCSRWGLNGRNWLCATTARVATAKESPCTSRASRALLVQRAPPVTITSANRQRHLQNNLDPPLNVEEFLNLHVHGLFANTKHKPCEGLRMPSHFWGYSDDPIDNQCLMFKLLLFCHKFSMNPLRFQLSFGPVASELNTLIFGKLIVEIWRLFLEWPQIAWLLRVLFFHALSFHSKPNSPSKPQMTNSPKLIINQSFSLGLFLGRISQK